MKFNDEKLDVTVSGPTQRQTFGIALNKKTFDVIVSSQYKNVYRAALIELYQNTNDTQIQAGNGDIPSKFLSKL